MLLLARIVAAPGTAAVLAAGLAGSAPPVEWSLIRHVLRVGGFPLATLAVLTAATLAVTVAISESLREDQIMPRHFWLRLRRLLTAGRLEQAAQACARNRSAIALIALPAIQYRRRAAPIDPVLLRDIMEGELHRQSLRVTRLLRYLREIADLAPVIGLLIAGLGWLTTLHAVELDAARAQPATLSAGLTHAGTAAAAGLLASAGAVCAHAYFRGQAAKRRASLTAASSDLYAILARKAAS